MCNNIMFIANKMFDVSKIHPSMVMLFKVAADKAKICTPSALARALNVSPQTVKNWSERGISKEGAMSAQARFGCDANVLRAQREISFVADRDNVASKVVAMDTTRNDIRNQERDVYADQALAIFLKLPPEDRKGALAALKSYVQNLGPPRDGQTLSMAV